jgi:hypothetical protein
MGARAKTGRGGAKAPPVIVKKVRAYPIDCSVGPVGPGAAQIQILKLTPIGFIADVGRQVFKVADEHAYRFELPVLRAGLAGQMKVIKTYDQFFGKATPSPTAPPAAPATVAQRRVEFHFIGLGDEARDLINDFLRRIKQN